MMVALFVGRLGRFLRTARGRRSIVGRLLGKSRRGVRSCGHFLRIVRIRRHVIGHLLGKSRIETIECLT